MKNFNSTFLRLHYLNINRRINFLYFINILMQHNEFFYYKILTKNLNIFLIIELFLIDQMYYDSNSFFIFLLIKLFN